MRIASPLIKAVRFVWERNKTWVLCSVLLTVLIGLYPMTTLWLSKELINQVARLIQGNSEDYALALFLLLLQFLATLVVSLLTNLQQYMNRHVEIRLDHDLQEMVMAKTTTVPMACFEQTEFYNHLERTESGQGARFLAPLNLVFEIAQLILSVCTLLWFLLTVHWSLVVLSVAGALPILWVQSRFGNHKFRFFQSQTPLMRELSYMGYLLRNRQAAKEIRLFGLASHLMVRWSEKYWQNAKQSMRLMRRQQAGAISLDGLTSLFYLGAAGIIIWLIRTTSVQIGDFVAIGQAVQGTQQSVNQISSKLARLYEEKLYLRDFFQFLEFNVSESAPLGTERFPVPLTAGISVEGVSFRYPHSEQDILRDVSFSIRKGEKLAIVGENGSGKTTLVKCLMGLYPITGGQICYDGLLVEEIEERERYKHINVIFQDFLQYAFTARENIVFGDIDRHEDEQKMRQAAQLSGADAFIEKLPNRYDTHLGRFLYEGEDLSGGQWQKIALARALFRDGEVIILDEPTAALDPKAEMEVFRQFESLTKDKTAIFISHRMSAARMADRILVMKDGRAVEFGSHEELMLLGAEYRTLYEMQSSWFA